MSLSKREQFLLFFMGMVAVLIFFVTIFILPMNTSINSLKTQKTTLQSQKDIIDATLPQAAVLKTQQVTKVADVNAELAKIESPLLASQFERWLLPLTTKYDMRVVEAKFSEPALSTPSGSVVLIEEPVYGLKTMIEAYTKETTVPDSTITSKSVLMKTNYTYKLQSNYKRFRAVLDDISAWNTSFFVTDAAYNFSTGTVTLGIDAYTVDKISYVGDKIYQGDYSATGDNSSVGSVGVVDDGTTIVDK